MLAAGARLRGLLLLLQPLAVDRRDLENVERTRDRADLVGALRMADLGGEIAASELGECMGDRLQRLDAAPDHHDREQDDAERTDAGRPQRAGDGVAQHRETARP